MKVVLDEMLPAAVAGLLSGHDVTTAKAAGYTGLSNGDLIRRAAACAAGRIPGDRRVAQGARVPTGMTKTPSGRR